MKLRTFSFLLFTAVLLSAQAQPPAISGERRTALVIGNASYVDAPLKNPVNDARALAEALKASGFQVTKLENASREAMFTAVRDFGSNLVQGGIGLFYFAGHGLQVKGKNYLIPVGTDIRMEDEVPVQGLELDLILAKMEFARNRLNLLILDASRTNPFARSFPLSTSGLAQMDAPVGSHIAMSTAPGQTVLESVGSNSLYTQHLLANLKTPGLNVEELFKRVSAGVRKDSNGAQMPWDSNSKTGDFYFVPGGVISVQVPPVQPVQPTAVAAPMVQPVSPVIAPP